MASINQPESYKIILKGNPKSTQNSYKFHSRGGYITKPARKLKDSYIKQINEQWKKPPLSEDLEINVQLYFGDKRKRDWDNFHKLSMDAMEKIVYLNDNQIKKALVEVFFDKDNPRIEIEIYEQK